MNALDKLRKLTRDIEPDSDPILWDILRDGVEQSWDCEEDDGKTLTGALVGIADQIEREQDVGAGPYDYRLVRMTWAVRWVMRDMERHLLGHEDMEDSPVARWARELREALDGRDDEEVTDVATVRADAMEAWRWVRDYGGLERVKQDALCWNTAENIAQATLDWLARVCPVAGIEKCGYGVALEKLDDAIKRRLMPEGYEWPRYEDGEPVRFEDELPDFAGTIYKTVKSVMFNNYGYVVIDNAGGSANVSVILKSGQRVKRPQVLAADGEPLEVGQRVWDVETGKEVTVSKLSPYGDRKHVDVSNGCDTAFVLASKLTHQRPVLDAGGVPIHDGDKVWIVENGHGPRIVKEMHGPSCVYLLGISAAYRADQLTHTKPEPRDSWERIEEDAESVAKLFDNFDADASEDIRSIVHRCRALAERERGE